MHVGIPTSMRYFRTERRWPTTIYSKFSNVTREKNILWVEEANITHLQVKAEYGAVEMCLEGDLERKIPKSHESVLTSIAMCNVSSCQTRIPSKK